MSTKALEATTNFVYNKKKLDNASIWSIGKANYGIVKANYCKQIRFLNHKIKNSKHLAFLIHFLNPEFWDVIQSTSGVMLKE